MLLAHQLGYLAATVTQRDAWIAGLNGQVNTLLAQIAALGQAATAKDRTHRDELKELKRKHQELVKEMDAQHELDIDTLADEVERLKIIATKSTNTVLAAQAEIRNLKSELAHSEDIRKNLVKHYTVLQKVAMDTYSFLDENEERLKGGSSWH